MEICVENLMDKNIEIKWRLGFIQLLYTGSYGVCGIRG